VEFVGRDTDYGTVLKMNGADVKGVLTRSEDIMVEFVPEVMLKEKEMRM
jgi:hypothetical protein